MSDHGIVRRDADGQWTTPDLGLETVGHPDGTSDPVPAVLLVPAVVVAAIPCMASLASFAGRWWQVTLGHPDPPTIGRLHRRTAWSAVTFGALATVAAVAWSAGAIATLAAAYGAIALSVLVAVLVWWAATYQAFVRLDAHGVAAAHATPGTSPPNRADAGDGPA